jgi:glycoprotein endo-alpha-1,2-mannosidase
VNTQGLEGRKAPSRIWLALLAVLLLLFSGGPGGDRYLVGAHYYAWYPANFAQGYLRAVLEPRQTPALGEYDSRSAAIAERQIAIAAAHGIDFFTLDWWPNRPKQNEAIDSGLLHASNIAKIRFALFYESSDLAHGENPGDSNDIVFDAQTAARFVSDMVTIARRYFAHPSYLRIDGRPVVILYITRMVRGLFPHAMREMRRALAAEGYDPFVIGDEIFWAVIEANEDPDAPSRVTSEPQVSRIRLFDAITGYNLYMESLPRHRGYGAESQFVNDSVKLYQRYRKAGATPIVPDVIPGFNDRGHRLELGHYAIPRRWTEDASEGSFFAESIDRIAKPLVDDKLRMILITSWNEWNEDTAIEPVSIAPPTTDDTSGRRLFTQGYAYEGYGDTYVDIVRKSLRH